MEETNVYTEDYEAFVANLDIKMRDAVTMLMIETRTRPDDPQMVGVCLTAVAMMNNSKTQERVLKAQKTTLETLDELKKDPDLAQGLKIVETLTGSLKICESAMRNGIVLCGLVAGVIACFWFATMAFAWNAGYNMAQNDIQKRIHGQLCNDLYGSIASVSTYWRKSLHMSAAADRLANTALTSCPR